MQDILERAANYRHHCAALGGGHYLAGKAAAMRHHFLGIPATICTAIVGASIFATLQHDPAVGWKVLAGSLALMAAVLSGLHTYFNSAEAAEKHKSAGAAYGSLRREIDTFFLRYGDGTSTDRTGAITEVERIAKRLGELAATSPDLADRYYNAARDALAQEKT